MHRDRLIDKSNKQGTEITDRWTDEFTYTKQQPGTTIGQERQGGKQHPGRKYRCTCMCCYCLRNCSDFSSGCWAFSLLVDIYSILKAPFVLPFCSMSCVFCKLGV